MYTIYIYSLGRPSSRWWVQNGKRKGAEPEHPLQVPLARDFVHHSYMPGSGGLYNSAIVLCLARTAGFQAYSFCPLNWRWRWTPTSCSFNYSNFHTPAFLHHSRTAVTSEYRTLQEYGEYRRAFLLAGGDASRRDGLPRDSKTASRESHEEAKVLIVVSAD